MVVIADRFGRPCRHSLHPEEVGLGHQQRMPEGPEQLYDQKGLWL